MQHMREHYDIPSKCTWLIILPKIAAG